MWVMGDIGYLFLAAPATVLSMMISQDLMGSPASYRQVERSDTGHFITWDQIERHETVTTYLRTFKIIELEFI